MWIRVCPRNRCLVNTFNYKITQKWSVHIEKYEVTIIVVSSWMFAMISDFMRTRSRQLLAFTEFTSVTYTEALSMETIEKLIRYLKRKTGKKKFPIFQLTNFNMMSWRIQYSTFFVHQKNFSGVFNSFWLKLYTMQSSRRASPMINLWEKIRMALGELGDPFTL